jgi:hypothetical protein
VLLVAEEDQQFRIQMTKSSLASLGGEEEEDEGYMLIVMLSSSYSDMFES